MSLSGLIGRLMKRLLMNPRLKKLTWEQITVGVFMSIAQFGQTVENVSEAGAAIPGARGMSIAGMAAHLAAANRAVIAQLNALRAGGAAGLSQVDLYPDTGERTFAQVKEDLLASQKELGKAVETPITSAATAVHPFYGSLTAREWLASVAAHYEYHLAQAERIMRTEAFRKMQGAGW
jgi:hypothetical protein